MQKSNNKFKENINLDILKRLNYIYDTIISKEKTLEYSKKINRLINHYKKLEVKTETKDAWSESTILLITYADSISKGISGKSLNNFGTFYKKYLKKFINSIHFLPFFPSSGDGGFSVKNHFEVDKIFKIKFLKKYPLYNTFFEDILGRNKSLFNMRALIKQQLSLDYSFFFLV